MTNRKAIIDLRLTPHCGGSFLANIIFSQCWHYQMRCNQGKPFYKFVEPAPENLLYKPGDSWIEELQCSRREFDHALKKIGCFKKSWKVNHADYLIWITKTKDRVNLYEINFEKAKKIAVEPNFYL